MRLDHCQDKTIYMNTTKKKIMILGGGNYQMQLIEWSHRKGYYVVVITPPGDYPGIAAADKVYYQDAKDERLALEAALAENIDGIISDQGDIFVRPVAYVAEKMGLSGNGYKTAMTYTDKHLMRERSKGLGLPTIDSTVVDTLDEAREAFRSLGGGTAIIKPVDASSSRGISRIPDEEELVRKWEEAKECSRSGGVIVERFVEGPQFEVDSIAAGGQVRPLMYADLDEFRIPNVFSSKTRLYPSVADASIVSRLLEYNQKINEGFGMYQGISHNEYILDEKTGEIYLIEAALRGGGTYIATDIARMQTGIDTQKFLVEVAMGERTELPEFEMNQCHCGYACFYMPEGEIVSMEGSEEVEALDYVIRTKLGEFRVGQKTKAAADKNQRCAIILKANNRAEILERIENIKSMLKIQVMTENGIKGPIWE